MARSGGHRNDGWVPRQHGAWAMLIAPLLLGIMLRLASGSPTGAAPGTEPATPLLVLRLVLLGTAWMLGYFTFNAATLWLKARPRRRPAFIRPLLTYGAATATAGCGALLLAPHLLWWAPIYAVLTGLALYLVHRGDERSVASGFVTIAAASLMAVTTQADTPAVAVADHWALAAVCLGYFFGTVLYVKTLIRERGKPLWIYLSAGYHAALVVTAGVLAATGGTPGMPAGVDPRWAGPEWAGWACFAAVLAVRAITVPVLGPLRGRSVTPKQAGIGEAVASVVLFVLALAL